MSVVTLVSGGLDSSLMALMVAEVGLVQYPLYIDYGQINCTRELQSCMQIHKKFELPMPKILKIPEWGKTIHSGLTDRTKDVFLDAFLPNRNLLLLLSGNSYAYQIGAHFVAIGLLNDDTHLFPDQTQEFLINAEKMLNYSTGKTVRVLAPLSEFSKSDVIALANEKGLTGTYSCHLGKENPCGRCISCREFETAVEEV